MAYYIIDNNSLNCWGIGSTEAAAWHDYAQEMVRVGEDADAAPRVNHQSSAFRTSGAVKTVVACVSDEDLDEVVGKPTADSYRDMTGSK